ncbi:MAG: glycosyltransferase family 39 protein [Planctomycetota bacterium]|nr:glycosyltransferase family 39 protein [Planctomycetota bacterium]
MILPLGVAAAVRMTLVLAFLGTTLLGDEGGYLRLGRAWAEFGAYPGHWAPGYPWLMGLLHDLVGDQAGSAKRLVQVLLSIWTGAHLAYTAGMFGGRRAGVLAAWIYALYLPLAAFSALLYSESLFLAAFVPFTFHTLRLSREGRLSAPWWRPIAAGVFLGLAALTRESTILFVLPASAWVAWDLRGRAAEKRAGNRTLQLWSRGDGPLAIAPAAILLASFALTVLPWTARNAHTFGRLVPVGVTAGSNAAINWNAPDLNFDLALLGDEATPTSIPGKLRARIRGDEPEAWHRRHAHNHADQVRLDIVDGARFAADNPVFFLRSRVVELVDLVSPLSFLVRQLRLVDDVGEPLESGRARWWLSLLAVLSWPLLALLAIQGWATVRDAATLQSFATLTILCTSSVVLIQGLTRLRVPMIPILMVLAAVAFATTNERPPKWRRAVASCTAVVLVIAWIPSLVPTGLSLFRLW